MGYLDEATSTWSEDSIHRVTTNDHGVNSKVDLLWSNGGVYYASGFDAITGCGAPIPDPTGTAFFKIVKNQSLNPHVLYNFYSLFC